MSKLYATLVPLLAVTALAVAPAIAQAAEPYWTSDGKVIKEGLPENVKTSGTMTFHLLGKVVPCKVKDEETIENPLGGGAGIDKVKSFLAAGCVGKPSSPCLPLEKIEFIAHGLEWPSELLAGSPIRDEISGMELEFKCNGTLQSTYSGELTPAVTSSSSLEFGAGSGELESGTKKLTIEGIDALKGPSGDTKIGAEEVELEPHWYSDGVRIPENTPENVSTAASMTMEVNAAVLTCKLRDGETILNPTGGGAGTDTATGWEFECKRHPTSPCPPSQAIELIPTLPWGSELIAGTPITDEISGMALTLKCSGATVATYTGSLTPKVGNSALVFSSLSGELLSGTKKLKITGSDKLTGPAGDTKITAEDP